MPNATLTIDLGAVARNYKILSDKARTVVGASIKADAYGLGMIPVAQTLAQAGCKDFFVATIDEAIALRQEVAGNIFVLNGIHAGDRGIPDGVLPILNSLADIKAWRGPCGLHFDTGMNRLGISGDETQMLIDNPGLYAHLDVQLAMSHFVSSDDDESDMNAVQCERFATLKAQLPFKRWSLANSSGIFHAPDDLYDLVRPGYALYGGNPTPEADNPMERVVTLEVPVLQTRAVKEGESIGYNATHIFGADTETATLALGYADGFFRANSNESCVYFKGQPCPVLGRVSMDLCAVGIGHLAEKPVLGDMIEVLGPTQSIDELADTSFTIGYEVLTSLGGRHQRRYIKAHG